MYPMPTPIPPMGPYAPGASMFSTGMFSPAMFSGGAQHLAGLPLQQGAMGQSGGLLSKLLGGAKAGGGGITNIVSMLQNAHKAIGVVQSVGPMVQQYAPLVKSLPALVSFMRNSSSDNSSEDSSEISSNDNSSEKIQVSKGKKSKQSKLPTNKTRRSSKLRQPSQSKPNKQKQEMNGIPAPKLYI